MHTLFRSGVLAVALGLAGAAAPAQTTMLGAEDVTRQLRAQGFTVHDIEIEDGLWEVDISEAGGRRGTVYIDPATGAQVRERDRERAGEPDQDQDQDRDRNRERDGDEDGEPDQDRDRDRDREGDAEPDRDRDRRSG